MEKSDKVLILICCLGLFGYHLWTTGESRQLENQKLTEAANNCQLELRTVYGVIDRIK